jgi:serine palmitoyltransferase
VELEERLAKFMGTNKSIVYSSDIATMPSVIPAFSKAGDIIVCDDGVGYTIQEACKLSRSEIITYKHNDMGDLENKLKSVVANDQGPKKKKLNRRFIIVEAISSSYGDIAPLQRLVDLKFKYKFRLVLEESYSFGVLGPTGRGICEEFKVPITDVDIVTAGLGNSLAAVGGFCCGPDQIVDHQRLSGAGYVFSASSPPYISIAAIEGLNVLEAEPARLKQLRENSQQLTKGLREIVKSHVFVRLSGGDGSPIVVVSFPQDPSSATLATQLYNELLELGSVVTLLRSCLGERQPFHGIRIHVTHSHTREDIAQMVDFVGKALKKVFNKQ